MKKLLLILLITISGIAHCQNNIISEFINNNSGKEGNTVIILSSKMFELFSNTKNENPDYNTLMKNIENISMIISENKNTINNINTNLLSNLYADNFELLMEIKEVNEDITFLIKEESDIINELIMLVDEEVKYSLVCIQGNIDLNFIPLLSKSMNIEGFDHFEKLGVK